MDFVRSTSIEMNLWPVEHFCPPFFPDQCWSGKKRRTKVFNWSEVHFYRSNFLQNPYFNGVWPNFLVWSPPWLYASSVKNKTKFEIIWFDLLLTLYHKLRRAPCDILLTSTYWQEMFCNLLCDLFDPQYKVAKLLLPFHLHTDRPILKLIYFYHNAF